MLRVEKNLLHTINIDSHHISLFRETESPVVWRAANSNHPFDQAGQLLELLGVSALLDTKASTPSLGQVGVIQDGTLTVISENVPNTYGGLLELLDLSCLKGQSTLASSAQLLDIGPTHEAAEYVTMSATVNQPELLPLACLNVLRELDKITDQVLIYDPGGFASTGWVIGHDGEAILVDTGSVLPLWINESNLQGLVHHLYGVPAIEDSIRVTSSQYERSVSRIHINFSHIISRLQNDLDVPLSHLELFLNDSPTLEAVDHLRQFVDGLAITNDRDMVGQEKIMRSMGGEHQLSLLELREREASVDNLSQLFHDSQSKLEDLLSKSSDISVSLSEAKARQATLETDLKGVNEKIASTTQNILVTRSSVARLASLRHQLSTVQAQIARSNSSLVPVDLLSNIAKSIPDVDPIPDQNLKLASDIIRQSNHFVSPDLLNHLPQIVDSVFVLQRSKRRLHAAQSTIFPDHYKIMSLQRQHAANIEQISALGVNEKSVDLLIEKIVPPSLSARVVSVLTTRLHDVVSSTRQAIKSRAESDEEKHRREQLSLTERRESLQQQIDRLSSSPGNLSFQVTLLDELVKNQALITTSLDDTKKDISGYQAQVRLIDAEVLGLKNTFSGESLDHVRRRIAHDKVQLTEDQKELEKDWVKSTHTANFKLARLKQKKAVTIEIAKMFSSLTPETFVEIDLLQKQSLSLQGQLDQVLSVSSRHVSAIMGNLREDSQAKAWQDVITDIVKLFGNSEAKAILDDVDFSKLPQDVIRQVIASIESRHS